MVYVRLVSQSDVPFLIDLFQNSLSERYGPKDFAFFVRNFVQHVFDPRSCTRAKVRKHHMYIAAEAESNEFLGVIGFRTNVQVVEAIDALILRGDARRKYVVQVLFAQLRHYDHNFQVARMYRVIPTRTYRESQRGNAFTDLDLELLEQKHNVHY